MPHRRPSPIHYTPIEESYLESLKGSPPGPSGPTSPPFRINLDSVPRSSRSREFVSFVLFEKVVDFEELPG